MRATGYSQKSDSGVTGQPTGNHGQNSDARPPRRTNGNVERVRWDQREDVRKQSDFGSVAGGVGRFGYLLIVGILMFLAYCVLTEKFVREGERLPDSVAKGPMVLLYLMLIGATFLRLNNVGSSPLHGLFIAMPIYNVLLLVRCLMLPSGFEQTRKLDLAAKIILIVVISIFIAAVSYFIHWYFTSEYARFYY